MKKKASDELSNKQIIKNIFFAVKTLWAISKSSILNNLWIQIYEYGSWLFFGTYFIRIIIDWIEEEKSFKQIAVFIFISMSIYYILSFFDSYFRNKTEPVQQAVIFEGLYKKIYKKARNVELRCYEDSEFYNKYTMAIDGAADKLYGTLKNGFSVIAGLIATIFAFIILFDIDKAAVVFVIAPIIGNTVFGRLLNKEQNKQYREDVKNQRGTAYVNRIMYLADYAKEMRLSNVFKLMMKRYDESVAGTINVVDKHAKKLIPYDFLKGVLVFPIIFEGVMLFAAYRTIVTGVIGLPELSIMFSIMSATTWMMLGMFNSIVQLHQNGIFVEYFRSFISYEEKIPEDWDGEIPEPVINSIEFCNVSFSYKNESYKNQAVDISETKSTTKYQAVPKAMFDMNEQQYKNIKNLSFKINGGEHIALVGHNGAGKTTIIKLLFRLYDPDEGEILLNGKNIKCYQLKVYRSLFAAAFQDYRIFAQSVKNNVLMGRSYDTPEKTLIEALKKADIYDKVITLPHGVDTILTREFDEEGAVLSGGQYQKIVMARAFAQDTLVKVFDEPSSALDPIAEYQLYTNIMQDTKNKTMIFISHRLSSVQEADRVYMLENGNIIEQGTHMELLKQGGAYADMYNKQAKNYTSGLWQ